MRTFHVVTILAATLMLAPLTAFAAPAKGKAAHAIHATTGTVKSIDANTMVIARPGKKKSELSFTLNGTTRRDGSIVVGAPVSVRYENEGKNHVATAVAVRPASSSATNPPASAKTKASASTKK